MLEHLEIRNFALIENLSMDFSAGFNVITGETGAGKSIILGALGLLMGEKADSSSIRTGAEEIVVNAVVSVPQGHEIIPYLEELGIEPEDNQIIIRRNVKENGKSSIKIQGISVSRSELTVISDALIDMHGQSEHQSLLSSDKQRKIIDSYSHNQDLLKECQAYCHEIASFNKKKEELIKDIEEGKKTSDYLSFALEEIQNAKLQVGEDDELKEKISVLSNFESIYENLSLASDKLKDIRTSFYDVHNLCAKAAKTDSQLADFAARLESSRIETEDISQGIREYLASVNYSEDAVNQMQDRLVLIQKLKRKYGPTIESILAFSEEASKKLEATNKGEEMLESIEKDLKAVSDKYFACSRRLSMARKASALELEKKIEATLKTLGMPNSVFSIRVNKDESKISSFGFDTIAFYISANPGEPEKEMKEIASGGELSRVMLALKTVLAKADSIQTQIFDEVDSGIGGTVALSLASCICDLAKTKQVVAITHLASIASRADSHFVVSKSVEGGRTFSHITQTEGENRVHEIARMLSGDETDVSLEHARKILNY